MLSFGCSFWLRRSRLGWKCEFITSLTYHWLLLLMKRGIFVTNVCNVAVIVLYASMLVTRSERIEAFWYGCLKYWHHLLEVWGTSNPTFEYGVPYPQFYQICVKFGQWFLSNITKIVPTTSHAPFVYFICLKLSLHICWQWTVIEY